MLSEENKISTGEMNFRKQKDYQTLSPSKQTVGQTPEGANVSSQGEPDVNKKRVPRKVIYFSDGLLEEYSTDEEELEERKKTTLLAEEKKNQPIVDLKSLSWVPWFIYQSWFVGSTMLSYADHFGEKLAWFFGITSPKYYYELEEFKKMQEDEATRKEKQETEMHGWTTKDEVEKVVEAPPTINDSVKP